MKQLFHLIRSLFTTISLLYLNIIYENSWTMAFVRQDNWMESSGLGSGSSRMPGASITATTTTTTTTDSISLNDNITIARPCDKEFDLYEMINFNFTITKDIVCGSTTSKCSRNFSAQNIPHTNLILIISINNPQCDCQKKKLTIEPEEVKYTREQECKFFQKEKYRKKPEGCYNYHPEEKEIHQCGKASSLESIIFIKIKNINNHFIDQLKLITKIFLFIIIYTLFL